MESTFEEDTFCEQFLSPKDVVLRKIEFIFADVGEQIERGDKTIIIRTSFENSHYHLKYSSQRKKKLKRDLCCIQQIREMLKSNKKSTKREMYYQFKELYETQRNIDRSIQQICELLGETRYNLNILSCGKGIMRGTISFVTNDASFIDARTQTVLIEESLLNMRTISEAEFILVVEKEAAFQKLLDENFFIFFPRSILLTAKGYPDICSRNVLRHLVDTIKIPVFGLFDADAYGIEIYLTYKYGSILESSECRDAFIPQIQWVGVFPSDCNKFPINQNQFSNLSHSDSKKLFKLLNRSIQLNEQVVRQEIDYMLQLKTKFEIEAVSSIGEEYLSRALLYNRIRHLLDASKIRHS
ncbi:unnamed protein product [Caenorhabditis bovis]|uniref:DNA topoisomerase (ATP-hydrolyzing) n=1 Tax=Caenorhabditis bovis TaxID=2654633 RepID=A0A8S1F7W2_9PELO|nr:unnamed protein product [Caenorhabditis bovis]